MKVTQGRPILARLDGRWQTASLVGWHRDGGDWTAYTWIRTGPPQWSSRFYPLPAVDVRDALPCLTCAAAQRQLALTVPA